jgi:transposase
MTIETLGVDIAKNVFQLHGVNRNGRVVLKRRVMRDELLAVIARIDRCTIVLEACTGAFYWARKFEALGHQVKLISPQYVKPFVRRQKNDGNDAEAICTAARQPHIPFVPRKASSSRISKPCIAPDREWSTTAPPSSARFAVCCWIAALPSPRALQERGA